MQILEKNMGSLASGRPGGNPEFGKTIKRDAAGIEPLEKLLNIRLTSSMDEALRNLGDRRLEFVREAIAQKLGRELAAQTAKTETTELETEQGQQPDNSQTTQLNLELATDPTLTEQVATPKTRRKAGQNPARKQALPKSQTQNRKNTATEN
ncbi:hypothetical protein LC605_01315 [Nostoc sp. CHAB 5836]|uniref:hypothetical protein n=1 Tax=Nostoc sp. CHAB 5836 TaxID=2780404 RepID=UPI001E4884D8|nr:hypothetical protein [Nostoc sp. CHAB 5836]MCC5613739.1 hypothetical protein [Nostoc sp. CHAB 5836]